MLKYIRDEDILSRKETISVQGRKVRLLILSNRRQKEAAPGMLWIHGGGYITGMKEMAFLGRAAELVRDHGAVVVSPDYALAPFHRYPAALEDCYGALVWMKEHSGELNIRSDQIMCGGESAGGRLCAAMCLYARDHGDVKIAYQMPLYPMIANYDTESSKDNHAKIWNTKRNHFGWKMYLGGAWDREVPGYAAVLRTQNLADLPPAYTFVGGAEPFYEETKEFVRRMREAGNTIEMDEYPGMYHAFDMIDPDHELSRIAIGRFHRHFAFAVNHYFAPQE